MPSRLIREGILTSERIDQLDAAAEVFYRRLMSKVDDHGLYDARPSILRASLYPLRVDRVREADITRWIAACEKAGVIALYHTTASPTCRCWTRAGKARSEPKYPLPTPENTCAQPQTPVPVFGVVVVVEDDNDALLARMLKAIEWQRAAEDWQKDKGKFIPYPATWLNDARWEDEPPTNGESPASLWHETAGGIKAKGAELGVPYTREDECRDFAAYRTRVFMAAGHREAA
jgi:hypothetical protein